MIPRVYVDTSVIGGCLDKEFGRYSEGLRRNFASGRLRAVISDVTQAELLSARPEVRALMELSGFADAEVVTLDDEALALASAYIRDGAVSEAHRVDARHIAVATVRRVDVLVSWNFKHIVKLSRIRAFNAVNLKLGYPELEIRSPLEVLIEEK